MMIYHAGLTGEVLKEYHRLQPSTKLNVLFSHGRQNPEAYDFHTQYRSLLNSLVLDSGTWTLNNCPNPAINITPETYRDWVSVNGHHYEFYFGFDADYGKNGFYENDKHQRFLEDEGLKPVPVIRDIEGEEVDYYIERDHKIIAIGSAEVVGVERINRVVLKLYNAGIKVHLFGTTKFEHLIDAPVYSCDSSSWTQAGGHNEILFWNDAIPSRNKKDRIKLERYTYPQKIKKGYFMGYEYKVALEAFLEKELGLTYSDLQGTNDLFNRQLVNVQYFAELERHITEYHQEQGWQY